MKSTDESSAQLPSVIFTLPTIGYLPIRWVYLPTIYQDSLTALKTVPIDIVLLLGWGAITAATWMKTPFKILGDSELAFYWGGAECAVHLQDVHEDAVHDGAQVWGSG